MGSSNNHDLAHDHLRISVLANDTLDFKKLSNILVFQTSGFTITLYLMSLEYKQVYTLAEIEKFKIPRSIDELALDKSFVVSQYYPTIRSL